MSSSHTTGLFLTFLKGKSTYVNVRNNSTSFPQRQVGKSCLIFFFEEIHWKWFIKATYSITKTQQCACIQISFGSQKQTNKQKEINTSWDLKKGVYEGKHLGMRTRGTVFPLHPHPSSVRSFAWVSGYPGKGTAGQPSTLTVHSFSWHKTWLFFLGSWRENLLLYVVELRWESLRNFKLKAL